MSCNYAEGLSPYENKGKLGLPEYFDSQEILKEKVAKLSRMMKESKHTVLHTGAGHPYPSNTTVKGTGFFKLIYGISTSAGIPDFRGPKGVWTLEKKGLKPTINLDWNEAIPTKTHMGILKLVQDNLVKFVISQNIDGLHMKSGLPRSNLAELHGNMFINQCKACARQFVRPDAAKTVGQKISDQSCPGTKANGRSCRGKLADFVLDWEDELPDADLDLSDSHSSLADLSVVLGSTLQIIPSGNLPTLCKKYKPDSGRLVIINLQPTKHDKKADLLIRGYVDEVMELLLNELGLKLQGYNPNDDPVRLTKDLQKNNAYDFVEWTQDMELAKRVKASADTMDTEFKLLKKIKQCNKKKRDDYSQSNIDQINQVIIQSKHKKLKRDLENDASIKHEVSDVSTENDSSSNPNTNNEVKKEEMSLDWVEPSYRDENIKEDKNELELEMIDNCKTDLSCHSDNGTERS